MIGIIYIRLNSNAHPDCIQFSFPPFLVSYFSIFDGYTSKDLSGIQVRYFKFNQDDLIFALASAKGPSTLSVRYSNNLLISID